MNLEEAFGQAVRLRRRGARLNQEEFAALLVLNQGAVSRIENGQGSLTLDMVARIAAALRTTPSALMQEAQNLHGYTPLPDGRPRRTRNID